MPKLRAHLTPIDPIPVNSSKNLLCIVRTLLLCSYGMFLCGKSFSSAEPQRCPLSNKRTHTHRSVESKESQQENTLRKTLASVPSVASLSLHKTMEQSQIKGGKFRAEICVQGESADDDGWDFVANGNSFVISFMHKKSIEA